MAVPLVEISGLSVDFTGGGRLSRAVDSIDLAIAPGEALGLVGESGSGKSVTWLAALGLLPARALVTGSVTLEGQELIGAPQRTLETVRGKRIAMIFQDPSSCLNPVHRIGWQLGEALSLHRGLNGRARDAEALRLLDQVGIADARRRLSDFPHQLSGGLNQRVMIAMALAGLPDLLIADEPTTALDATIQAQILDLLRRVQQDHGMALVLISHDLGVVADLCTRVGVMYAGRMIEHGSAEQIFQSPSHPYTRGLLRSVPRLDRARGALLETIEGYPPNLYDKHQGCHFAPRCDLVTDQCLHKAPLLIASRGHEVACHLSDNALPADVKPFAEGAERELARSDVLLEVAHINKYFGGAGKGWFSPATALHAVKDVSFTIKRGETLGLVGESGCGKTTVGRMILKLESTNSGDIRFDGESVITATAARIRALRQRIQVIFQDPYASLNPRMTMGETLLEPLIQCLALPPKAAQDRVNELIDQVGLLRDVKDRFPHQLSGGQRQRIGIARALAFGPDLIVCDEPVSALDVSIQGQIINLLAKIQARLGVSYLFIAHDLAVVRHISHRVIVMYRGKVVEEADCDRLYEDPRHPYTRALLASAPVPDPEIERARQGQILQGEVGSVFAGHQGCLFANRCPMSTAECARVNPVLEEISSNHFAACIHHSMAMNQRVSA